MTTVELPAEMQAEITQAIAEMHAAVARAQAAQERVQRLWRLAAALYGVAEQQYEPVMAAALREREGDK